MTEADQPGARTGRRAVVSRSTPPSSSSSTRCISSIDQLGTTTESARRPRRMIRRFAELVEQTPALRAAQRDMMDRLVEVAAAGHGGPGRGRSRGPRAADRRRRPRSGCGACSTGHAHVFRREPTRRPSCATGHRRGPPSRPSDRHRACGPSVWPCRAATAASSSRLAAESANDARKQVIAAIKQARRAWRLIKAEQHEHHDARLRQAPLRAGPAGAKGTLI